MIHCILRVKEVLVRPLLRCLDPSHQRCELFTVDQAANPPPTASPCPSSCGLEVFWRLGSPAVRR